MLCINNFALTVFITLLICYSEARANRLHSYREPIHNVKIAQTQAAPFYPILIKNTSQPIEKPVVSEKEYVCALGQSYNLTCNQIWEAHKPYEKKFSETIDSLSIDDDLYRIDRKTHRLWLTAVDSPMEVPMDRLEFFNQSLQFYINKPYEHHFWCNGLHLIPQTIATIRSFNVPVIIHDITEISEEFITKNIFKHLMKDKHFCFAGDLAKQEIILRYGGLYADIGLEQLRDLDSYFRKYDEIIFVGWGTVDGSALGAKRNSIHLRNSLNFTSQIQRTIAELPVYPGPYALVGLPIWDAWKLFWALEKEPKTLIGFVYKDSDFNYHGFASWHDPIKNKVYNFTVNYYLNMQD